MKTAFDSSVLRKFIEAALEKLEGDWVILGGTLLPALGVDYRQTVDIDFAPVLASSNATSLKVMKIAERLGLPVEAINSSAEFFLKKAKGFRRRLVPLRGSRRCRVFRPALDLYLELKLARASDSDISDCRELIRYVKKQKLAKELSNAKGYVQKILKGHKRRGELESLLPEF